LEAGAIIVGSNPALHRNPIEGMSGSIRFFRDKADAGLVPGVLVASAHHSRDR
jgi:hypothetical protein